MSPESFRKAGFKVNLTNKWGVSLFIPQEKWVIKWGVSLFIPIYPIYPYLSPANSVPQGVH